MYHCRFLSYHFLQVGSSSFVHLTIYYSLLVPRLLVIVIRRCFFPFRISYGERCGTEHCSTVLYCTVLYCTALEYNPKEVFRYLYQNSSRWSAP
jgi:hypothetical protein